MPETKLSRRQMLQAAGGITFLASLQELALAAGSMPSTPMATSVEPLAGPAKLFPVFTALPYLQPGASSKLVENQEEITIAWQTDAVPMNFTLSYGENDFSEVATIVSHLRTVGYRREKDKRINYFATLDGLKLNRRYKYRVEMEGERVVEGFFTTRKPKGVKTRFVAFGDNSNGDISDRAIAFQAFKAKPDFVMNTGDLVYADGLENEYARLFFPVYNADEAGPRLGAPLMRAVPLYTVMANHDINGRDASGKPVVDFDEHHDVLGYFTNLHLPLNGPTRLNNPTPLKGAQERIDAFAIVVGTKFPRMANYSFEYGDAFFLCIDSNTYVDPTDSALQAWIERELKGSDSIWKFVVYHHPAFNVGKEHYRQQHMRVLAPIFERNGVDFVLNGHEHNYQRTRPIKFKPTDESRAKVTGTSDRLVPGDFTVDRNFDGKSKTKADGVVHIVTGAGGHILYDPEMNDSAAARLRPEDNNVDYVDVMASDRHSLTVFEVDGRKLKLRQIDEWGQLLDEVVYQK